MGSFWQGRAITGRSWAGWLCATALVCPAWAVGTVLPSVTARVQTAAVERPNGFPSDATLEALGARIGEVYLDKRPLFDVEGDDANTSLFRLANRLHIETREATIEEQLLFASGQLYRPRLFEESERILRDTRYLRDASIRPVGYRDGVVDVEVKTQDVWTLNPGVSFGRKGGKNTSGFELEELNVLGFGTQLGIGFKSGLDRDSKQIYYRDRQLGSTWLDLSAKYSDNSDGRLGELNLDHPFYALDTRWAAGGRYRDDQRTDSRYDLGKITDAYETRERYGSVYWGRSKGLVGGWARRYSAGLTYDYRAFLTIPGAAAPTLLPADRKLVQPWLAAEWIQDEFQTTRNRDQIEKTEDYSLGWHLRTQLGYASPGLGSDRSAAILSGSISKGAAPGPRQTVLFNASADGRVEGGAIAAGLLHAEGRYYFRQTPKRLFYASLALESGSNLDVDQQVLLGGDSGLRGYPLRYQAGTGKWLFTAEQRVFTDWYPFQMFNVGGAVFYDMGGTWGRDPLGAPSQGVLKDVGFGLRLGNSRSALGNVLHIDIAFPLDGDSSIKKVQLQIETKRRF